MIRTFLAIVATAFWCVLVFAFTLWATFPSQPIADRIRYEVPLRLGDSYTAEVGSVNPWWIGASVADLRLYRDEVVEGQEARTPVALLSRFKLAISPKSLLRRSPYVTGQVDTVDGSLTYQVGTSTTPKGGVAVTDLVLQSDGMPVGDLLALMPSFPATIAGNLGLDVALRAGDEGMKSGVGHLTLNGTDLTVSDVELPGMGPLGMDLPITSIDIEAEVADGHAKFTKGQIVSPLMTIDLSGDVALRDNLERSSVDLQITVSHLGSELASFEPMMASAQGSDGNYHFYCRGVLSRLNERSCSSNDRAAVRTRTGGARGASAASDAGAIDDAALDGDLTEGEDPASARVPQTDDERRRRRDEIRERLRAKREERAKAAGTVLSPPPSPSTEEQPMEEDPPLVEEEPDQGFEELIPEEVVEEGVDGGEFEEPQ